MNVVYGRRALVPTRNRFGWSMKRSETRSVHLGGGGGLGAPVVSYAPRPNATMSCDDETMARYVVDAGSLNHEYRKAHDQRDLGKDEQLGRKW